MTILEFPSHVGLRDSLLKNNYYHISNKTRGKEPMENLLFNVANFIHRQTNNSKLASEYYKIIIDYYKDTELYADASLALHQIEPANNWLSLFLEKKSEEFSDKNAWSINNNATQRRWITALILYINDGGKVSGITGIFEIPLSVPSNGIQSTK